MFIILYKGTSALVYILQHHNILCTFYLLFSFSTDEKVVIIIIVWIPSFIIKKSLFYIVFWPWVLTAWNLSSFLILILWLVMITDIIGLLIFFKYDVTMQTIRSGLRGGTLGACAFRLSEKYNKNNCISTRGHYDCTNYRSIWFGEGTSNNSYSSRLII